MSSEGECKELLVWMDREWEGGYGITAAELPSGFPERKAEALTFTPEEEKTHYAGSASSLEEYIFEPGKSLTKAGAFNMTSKVFNIAKLGKSTHYYTYNDPSKTDLLKGYGKVFQILKYSPLDKKSIRETGRLYPKAEVTARNIPITSDALRKKIGCTSGGEVHIFGLKSDMEGALLIICKRI